MARHIVPFTRVLRIGSSGKDVLGVKRALWRAAVYRRPRRWSLVYGPFAAKAVKTFQAKHNLQATGRYGQKTHRKLALYFDDYAFVLMGGGLGPTQTRARIVSAALLGHRKRGLIRYTQTPRRMEWLRLGIRPPDVPAWADCSSFATWTYWVAGADDPNAIREVDGAPSRKYDGYGYTGTLCRRGELVPLGRVRPGDLGFYGRRPFSHVVIAVSRQRPDGSVLVVSHGSDPGPYLLAHNYRSDFSHFRSYLD